MKVRLKLDLSQRRIFSSKWFQFHEGPIKTGGGNFDFEVREQFQFHEGPIKTQQASDVKDFANVSIPWRSD